MPSAPHQAPSLKGRGDLERESRLSVSRTGQSQYLTGLRLQLEEGPAPGAAGRRALDEDD